MDALRESLAEWLLNSYLTETSDDLACWLDERTTERAALRSLLRIAPAGVGDFPRVQARSIASLSAAAAECAAGYSDDAVREWAAAYRPSLLKEAP